MKLSVLSAVRIRLIIHSSFSASVVVGLLKITEFLPFIRRTRSVGEQCREFGCFGSILLRSEHLTCPFYGTREHNGVSSLAGAVGCTDWSILDVYGTIAPISEIGS
jgi:hypothetical protein